MLRYVKMDGGHNEVVLVIEGVKGVPPFYCLERPMLGGIEDSRRCALLVPIGHGALMKLIVFQYQYGIPSRL